jgi:hypothetical protein
MKSLKIIFINVLLYVSNSAGYLFYTPDIDHIEVFEAETFRSNVLNSNKATIMEFYADWCSYSKRFIPHWKNFANETILWQKNVVRIAALNCAELGNEICWRNGVYEYPQFKLYHARTTNVIGLRKLDEKARSETFMRTTIDFLEKQRHPPREWPRLYQYT